MDALVVSYLEWRGKDKKTLAGCNILLDAITNNPRVTVEELDIFCEYCR
jgi:hypothetical protein